jgi:DNA mismatch repair protein MutL
MAAVAEVELVTRIPGNAAAARVLLREGEVAERGARASAEGTVFTLRGLFAAQPARLKFMRSPASEASQVAAVVSRYALSRPEVAFSLKHDGRQSFASPGSGDLRAALAAVYGAETAARLLALDGAADGVAVRGLVSPPDVHRSNRAYIHLFVNGRWIQSRSLTYAVEEAYLALLPGGRHPLAIALIEVDPACVDVNVHPAKTEVRFQDEGAVFRALQRAVRASVLDAADVVEPRRPELLPLSLRLQPVQPRLDSTGVLGTEVLGSGDQAADRGETAHPSQYSSTPVLQYSSTEAASARHAPRSVLPVLRVVGQLAATYIAAEGPDGLYMVDQHAAHERVWFEQVLAQRGEGARQALLEPLAVELAAPLRAVLDAYRQELSELGFELDDFGEGAVLLRALPAGLGALDAVNALTTVLDGLASDERVPERLDRVAATIACHSSVRAGKLLATEEMRELLRQLEACEQPHTCPHGRPTMVHLSQTALERQFRRT